MVTCTPAFLDYAMVLLRYGDSYGYYAIVTWTPNATVLLRYGDLYSLQVPYAMETWTPSFPV